MHGCMNGCIFRFRWGRVRRPLYTRTHSLTWHHWHLEARQGREDRQGQEQREKKQTRRGARQQDTHMSFHEQETHRNRKLGQMLSPQILLPDPHRLAPSRRSETWYFSGARSPPHPPPPLQLFGCPYSLQLGWPRVVRVPLNVSLPAGCLGCPSHGPFAQFRLNFCSSTSPSVPKVFWRLRGIGLQRSANQQHLSLHPIQLLCTV